MAVCVCASSLKFLILSVKAMSQSASQSEENPGGFLSPNLQLLPLYIVSRFQLNDGYHPMGMVFVD